MIETLLIFWVIVESLYLPVHFADGFFQYFFPLLELEDLLVLLADDFLHPFYVLIGPGFGLDKLVDQEGNNISLHNLQDLVCDFGPIVAPIVGSETAVTELSVIPQ